MFAEQRKKIIIEMLRRNSSVSLNELIDTFEVSETTIRRDLTELENAGELKRTHGGAILRKESSIRMTDTDDAYAEEKKSIALIAAGMIEDGDTVALDSGTTTFEIAKAISHKNITLVTNSALIVSAFLSGSTNMQIHATGGLLRTHTKSFVGTAAEDFLSQLRPAKAFVAANGISHSGIATTAHMSEAGIKKAIIKYSKQKFLVVDHSKFGKEYFSVFASAADFDCIISDSGLSPEAAEDFRQKNIRLVTD